MHIALLRKTYSHKKVYFTDGVDDPMQTEDIFFIGAASE